MELQATIVLIGQLKMVAVVTSRLLKIGNRIFCGEGIDAFFFVILERITNDY